MNPIIDISYWQNPLNIDYDRLAASISGVIIRATYGSRKDAYFEQHYSAFKQRGVPVGVYSFITEYMPVADQILVYKSMTAGKQFELGYWADVEAESGAELLTLPTIRAWLAQADEAVGALHGIYTSWWMWQQCAGNSPDFGNRNLWAAHYGVNSPRLPVGWSNYVLHQYTSSYFAPGYSYRLDANRFNGDEAKLAAFIASNLSGEPPEPPAPETPLFEATVKSTATPYLNIRAASNAASTIVGKAYPGDKVSVFETTTSAKPWYRVDVGKWLAGWYTTRISDEPLHSASPLWQRDPQWASAKLGTSNTTIGDYGCLLTCVTMLVNDYLKVSYTPPQMNEFVKKVQGWVHYDAATKSYLPGGNLFRFASLWEAFPSQIAADKLIRTPLTPAPLNEIDALIEKGRPVIVETRLNKRYQHWVLITGKRDGKYVMNDPWTGKQGYFEDVYGEPARWIYSIVSYKHVGG